MRGLWHTPNLRRRVLRSLLPGGRCSPRASYHTIGSYSAVGTPAQQEKRGVGMHSWKEAEEEDAADNEPMQPGFEALTMHVPPGARRACHLSSSTELSPVASSLSTCPASEHGKGRWKQCMGRRVRLASKARGSSRDARRQRQKLAGSTSDARNGANDHIGSDVWRVT